MNRNWIGALALIVCTGQAFPQDVPEGRFKEGVHYYSIQQPPGYRPADDVQVAEVFSYLCNHCNTFEPYVQKWQQDLPEGVEFKRIPVEFGRAIWGLYARAYVTAAVLGIEDDSHVPMMENIWKKRQQLRTMEQLAEFYSQFGVDPEKFLATSKSFAVDMRMKREQSKVREYGVTGTPTMIVNGKYRISAGGAIGNYDQMLEVVDYLVARELEAGSTEDQPGGELETAQE